MLEEILLGTGVIISNIHIDIDKEKIRNLADLEKYI
jgi:hypothetical protein